tara:strand:+ start:18083 stop:18523 length:441 start_codon:yes stop_codon:yes gene_type:complete
MSDITFKGIAELIAAGSETVTADYIKNLSCGTISGDEKRALLAALANQLVSTNTPRSLASVQSGQIEGPGSVQLATFIQGSVTVIDTDGTATVGLDGTHQSVSDSTGDTYPESTSMTWDYIPGLYYAGRTLTVPTGSTILYTFILQ